jgi:folate-binding protein YgfZ
MPSPTPLHEITTQAGARFAKESGWLLPAHFGDPKGEYDAACREASLFDLSPRGTIELTGPEAQSFLHNLCTNDVLGLPVLSSCEAFFTNAKAKVIGHAYVYNLGLANDSPCFWLDVEPGTVAKMMSHLEHFCISEQVEFADRSTEYAQLYLAGPRATAVLTEALQPRFSLPGRPNSIALDQVDSLLHQVRWQEPLGLPGFGLLCSPSRAAAVWQSLVSAGARPAGMLAYETLRVEAGTPAYGKDFDEANLVMEVGRIGQAISYTKGCYLGQEPIVRARDLGHLNRTLGGLRLEGNEPAGRGATLLRDGNGVGNVTSSVASPRLGVIALAYIRRGSQDPGTVLEVSDGTTRCKAVVSALPFAGS